MEGGIFACRKTGGNARRFPFNIKFGSSDGSEATLASGSTITSPYYSKAASPVGFPTWFEYTPAYSAGGSMTFTSVSTSFSHFKLEGKACTVIVGARGTTGGSASNQLRVSKPIASVTQGSANYYPGTNFCENNGAFEAGTCFCTAFASADIICGRTAYGNYTLSDRTGLNICITYPIA